MARYKTTTPVEGTFTVNSLTDIVELRNLHMRYYLKVNGTNNDGEIIRIMNLIPTVMSQFKGTFQLAEIPVALGGFAAEAADKQKQTILTQINNGYYFLDGYLKNSWSTNLRSIKYAVPYATIVDSNTGKRLLYIARRNGRVISKTTVDGTTLLS